MQLVTFLEIICAFKSDIIECQNQFKKTVIKLRDIIVISLMFVAGVVGLNKQKRML